MIIENTQIRGLLFVTYNKMKKKYLFCLSNKVIIINYLVKQ